MDVFCSIVFLGLFVTIVVMVSSDMKKADAARRETHEMQRHFMAAGLAYFAAMTKYVSGCSPLDSVNYIDEE